MKKSDTSEAFALAVLLVGIMFLLFLMLGVSIKSKIAQVEHNKYVVSGHYYDGYVIRDDGHIWDYETTEVKPYSPVYVFFDDNGTPDEITDDFIFNIITDYEKLNL